MTFFLIIRKTKFILIRSFSNSFSYIVFEIRYFKPSSNFVSLVSAGSLKHSKLGSFVDSHDIVMRNTILTIEYIKNNPLGNFFYLRAQ